MEKKEERQKATPTEEMFSEILTILKSEAEPTLDVKTVDPEKLLETLESTLNDLRSESKRIAEKAGMTQEELAAYSQNPSNFTPEEWQLLVQIREQLDSYRQQAKEIAGPQATIPGAKKEATSSTGKRKGGGKKGWMPM